MCSRFFKERKCLSMPDKGMKKIMEYQVRSFEMDYYQYLPPSALLRVSGSAAFMALNEYGYEISLLKSRLGATWMLGMLELKLFEDIRAERTPVLLTFYTSPLYRSPATFMVRVAVYRGEQLVGNADICSMAVSIGERRTLRTDDVCAVLGMNHYQIQIPPPARILLPEEMEFVQTHTVQYYDCDRNKHMNAYRYTDLVCQVAGYWSADVHRQLSGLRMEYVGECRPGEQIHLYRKETEDGVCVKGVKEDGKLSFKSLIQMEAPSEEKGV